ncbi:MAG: hypothetical protein QOJ64_1299 [Acidobacteriota bacterium]|nr:hypothetical protein [Acidobacteriota bacterium]
MIKIRLRHHRLGLIAICALVTSLLSLTTSVRSTGRAPDKMKAEEVVAKHLDSIGTAAARSGEHSRVAVGTARATFKARGGSGTLNGRAVLGSVNKKALLAIAFNAPNYPGEKFGFDGKKFAVAYVTPGVRSTLGNFLLSHSSVFKDGLMGGTLSSAWALLNLEDRKAKIEYGGTEKIGDRLVHKLKYSPNKGADLDISLYFDATTFQHVRTQYERVVGARIAGGGIDNQASQQETRYKMIENFSDYKQEGELTLPHSYTLQLEITKTTGSSMDKWEMTLSEFTFNQAIDEKSLDVEAN